MKEPRLSKAETRILEQYWKLGTASVREVLESLPEDERVAYTTVQTLVYRLEEKGALKEGKEDWQCPALSAGHRSEPIPQQAGTRLAGSVWRLATSSRLQSAREWRPDFAGPEDAAKCGAQ